MVFDGNHDYVSDADYIKHLERDVEELEGQVDKVWSITGSDEPLRIVDAIPVMPPRYMGADGKVYELVFKGDLDELRERVAKLEEFVLMLTTPRDTSRDEPELVVRLAANQSQ